MFWRFGSYANISTIETLLDKPDVTLDELLDEADLLQELKQHNSKLIEFLRDENVLARLLEYVIDPKATYSHDGNIDDLDESQFGRQTQFQTSPRESDEARRSRLACEILSSGTWSLSEALMENLDHMRMFWSFLERDAPLDPVQAAYFTKVNETLLDKKTEEMLAFFISLDNIVPTMLKHVECPMIMDLLLKIISMDKAENGIGIVDWLQSRQLIPILLSLLSSKHSPTVQTSTGDFLKAIITISANASQHEQSCIGPNDLTRQLVSEPCIKALIADMLKGGNPLTVGVGIIIEVIRKNNSDYDPENLSGIEQPPSSRDPIYLGTLLRLFASHVPDFMQLIHNQKDIIQNPDGTITEKPREMRAAYGGVIEPLGFNRFKTCELMAELLHCSNMALLNEKGSDKYVKERDKERERLKALREKAREGNKEGSYAQDLGGFRFVGVMGEKGPLEVQNGDENSSEGTTEDDGFEDVSAESLLADDDVKGFGAKADADIGKEDEDVDLLFEDEPEAVQMATKQLVPKKEDENDVFVDEPLSPPLPAPSSVDGVKQSLPIPTIQLTSPAGDQSNPTMSTKDRNVDDLSPKLEKSSITDEEVEKEPTRTEDTKKDKSEITAENPESKPDTSHPSASSETLQGIEQVPASSKDIFVPPLSIKKSATPPPPYEEVVSDSSTSTAAGASSSSSASATPSKPSEAAPSTAIIAEGTNLELLSPSEDVTIGPSKEAALSIVPPQPEPPVENPFGDPEDVTQADVSNRPTFPDYTSFIEPDIDGSPVVGDYLKMQFVEHRVVVTILDFFFRFPWNNFLHNVVYDVVQQVFNGPMDRGYNRTLAIDLFVTGRITERIMEGQRYSDKMQRETRMRMGYMGHLTLIAEEVVKFTEKYPPEVLSQVVLEKVMHQDWIDYVDNVLAETRERDNAILGGFRPDQSLGPRPSAFGAISGMQGLGGLGVGSGGGSIAVGGGISSSDLDTIDLANGTGGVGSGGSSLFGAEGSGGSTGAGGASSGLLSSGFGSSSDEDDDDMDRDDDDDEDARMGGMGSGSSMSMIGSSGESTGMLGNDQFVNFLSNHINNADNMTSSEDDGDDDDEEDGDSDGGGGKAMGVAPAPLNVKKKSKKKDETVNPSSTTAPPSSTTTILPDTTFQRKNKLGLMLNSTSSGGGTAGGMGGL